MKRTAVAALAGSVLVAFGVVGWLLVGADQKVAVPTEVDSLAALDYAYAHAHSAPDEFCQVASSLSNCRVMLQSAGVAPTAAPELRCSRPYEPADKNLRAGRILRVTGHDDSGKWYETEVLAIAQNGKVTLMDPVYWVETTIGDSGVAAVTNVLSSGC